MRRKGKEKLEEANEEELDLEGGRDR